MKSQRLSIYLRAEQKGSQGFFRAGRINRPGRVPLPSLALNLLSRRDRHLLNMRGIHHIKDRGLATVGDERPVVEVHDHIGGKARCDTGTVPALTTLTPENIPVSI